MIRDIRGYEKRILLALCLALGVSSFAYGKDIPLVKKIITGNARKHQGTVLLFASRIHSVKVIRAGEDVDRREPRRFVKHLTKKAGIPGCFLGGGHICESKRWILLFVEDHPNAVSEWAIHGIPQGIAFGPDGRIQKRWEGPIPLDDFLEILSKSTGESEGTESEIDTEENLAPPVGKKPQAEILSKHPSLSQDAQYFPEEKSAALPSSHPVASSVAAPRRKVEPASAPASPVPSSTTPASPPSEGHLSARDISADSVLSRTGRRKGGIMPVEEADALAGVEKFIVIDSASEAFVLEPAFGGLGLEKIYRRRFERPVLWILKAESSDGSDIDLQVRDEWERIMESAESEGGKEEVIVAVPAGLEVAARVYAYEGGGGPAPVLFSETVALFPPDRIVPGVDPVSIVSDEELTDEVEPGETGWYRFTPSGPGEYRFEIRPGTDASESEPKHIPFVDCTLVFSDGRILGKGHDSIDLVVDRPGRVLWRVTAKEKTRFRLRVIEKDEEEEGND